jgi:protoporphyrinogen oxidase
MKKKVVIIGAGPAGLTAGFEFADKKIDCTVIEKLNLVGGLSRTEIYKGNRFDVGGHRFWTKIDYVNNFWNMTLGKDFMKRPRLSRIYYKNKFFHYPIKPFDVLKKLGPIETTLIMADYIRYKVSPLKDESSFRNYVINRFGKRLYRTFFKNYTEKLWGVPGEKISSDWAEQRIKGLSITNMIKTFLAGNSGGKIKTLITEFNYPKMGPGMLWEKVAANIKKRGGKVVLNSEVIEIRVDSKKKLIKSVVIKKKNGKKSEIKGTHFLFSSPLSHTVRMMSTTIPKKVMKAADKLNHRGFITVGLIVNKNFIFPDNWIYVHSPEVMIGRVQNYKNWSPYMVKDKNKTSVGVEYFSTKGDKLWRKSDSELIELAKREMETIGLIDSKDVEDGFVVKVANAYPVYHAGYEKDIDTLREFTGQFNNMFFIGRSGMHRYNNMDHSMLTAKFTADNIIFGADHDPWSVNTEKSYLEEKELK